MNKKLKLWLLKICTLYSILACVLCVQAKPANNKIEQDNPQEPEEIIRGKVVDEQGNPLAGASVYLKDETSQIKGGTPTLADGSFEISLNGGKTLFISMIGYKTQKTAINNTAFFRVVMIPDKKEIDDVVITGYVNKKVESFTGAVNRIDEEKLQSIPGNNLVDALQMFVPGLEITENNTQGSNPNVMPDIIIRGRSSFTDSEDKNLPIFILDGIEVELSTIFDMDIHEVESITVLKDAAATAFYGANATNGVVVVTTKPLKVGEMRIEYNNAIGITQPDLSDYHLMNPSEKLEFERLSGVYESSNPERKYKYEKLYNEKLKRIKQGVNSDWIAQPLRTGVDQDHSLRLYGGTQTVKYSFGVKYENNQGVMKESKRENTGFNFKISYSKNKKLFVANRTMASKVKKNESPYGDFSDYTKLNPYDRIKNEDGTFNNDMSSTGNLKNPLFEATCGNFEKDDDLNFSNNFQVKYNFSDALRLETDISVVWEKTNGEDFLSPTSTQDENKALDDDQKGRLISSFSKYNYNQLRVFLSYSKYLGTKHFLNINTGGNANQKTSESGKQTTVGYLSNKLNHISSGGTYSTYYRPSGTYDKERNIGAFFNANYIFDKKYFVDGSLRYDASSKYGTDNRGVLLWSFGGGWNIHEEMFVNKEIFGRLKLRASIGEDGNSNFAPYQAITTYRYNSDYLYYEGIGAMPISMANPDLKWEKTFKMDIGIDFMLFKNRVYGSFDYYDYTTNNLLVDMSTAPSIGFTTIKENVGEVKNSGVELCLNAHVIQKKDYNLLVSLNMSHNKNEIKKISSFLKRRNEAINKNSADSRIPLPLYEEGESMTALKVVRSAGIDPATGQEVFHTKDGNLTYEYDYRDKVVIGDETPKLQGSGGLNFIYKQWGISTRFTYRLGAENYNQTLATKIEGVNPKYNADRRVFTERWQKPGDIAKYTGYTKYAGTVYATDRFVKTEYMLQINTVNLYYNFSESTISKIGLKTLRLSLAANNIGRFSTIDEERGLSYPFAHTFLFSLSTKF